jgi:hypothetical protein
MKKDMEEAMKTLKPKRPLKPDFTRNTLGLSVSSSRGSFFLWQKLRHAPALALVIAVLLLSGTVYAATHWPEITAKFSSKTSLPSGNRIIGVDTTNCNYFQVHDKPVPTNEKVYYEIKKDSSLTDDQVVSMVQGICEENAVTDIMNQIVQPYIKQGLGKGMTGEFRLETVAKDSITVSESPAFAPQGAKLESYTYNIDSGIKVYDAKESIELSDLRPGDSISLLVKDTHPLPSEGDPNSPNHWKDSDLITVLAIVRTPQITGSPMTFLTHLGKDFVRTEPCNSNPSGFCRAYDFDN